MVLRRILAIGLLTVVVSGCRSGILEFPWFKSDQQVGLEQLWHQGYGFNNPNSERIRTGDRPLNLDGTKSRGMSW
ncbi:MAG TPA: hypothetical protein PKD64_08455 [Pirellulaceae bacterium]|nr:hypothetical protein [Pirellulaceae bacterium]HMO92218.1 hypothetical protein [Pirellulaceae bacterium]HMP68855.1 hypothetical protein [Pirellulaceae bacterium]